MQTNKFETLIKQQLEPVSTDWVIKLENRFPNIKVTKSLDHCKYFPDGKLYKKLVQCDLNLRTEMIMMTIAQDRNKLEFFYFGITSDETSDECLLELSNEYLDFLKNSVITELTNLEN